MRVYGKCLSDKLDDLRKDACAPEFATLKTCAEGAFRRVRAAAAAGRR